MPGTRASISCSQKAGFAGWALVLLGLTSCATTGPTGTSGVVVGVFEPDYRYPWTVQLQSCRGVLLNAEWVLTAAHCVPGETAVPVTVTRTDPSGATHSEQRKTRAIGGIIRHPEFDILKTISNDIALLRLEQPFDIRPHIQTVGLPADLRHDGATGTVAANTHTGVLPPGQLAVFRAPLLNLDNPAQQFSIYTTVASGSLCPGDSGSGFVTLEGGRAIVRGVLSQVTGADNCMTGGGWRVLFIDVFHYRDWILHEMRVTDHFLDGNTRVQWSGRPARGVLGVGCDNKFGTMWGPLYVRGVQEGANCASEQTQTVMCSLEAGQAGLRITEFSMKTALGDGTVQQESLAFSNNLAAYFGELPFGAFREFNCGIGSSIFDIGSAQTLEQLPD